MYFYEARQNVCTDFPFCPRGSTDYWIQESNNVCAEVILCMHNFYASHASRLSVGKKTKQDKQLHTYMCMNVCTSSVVWISRRKEKQQNELNNIMYVLMYLQVLCSESEQILHAKMRQLAPMHHQRGVTADMMDDMRMYLSWCTYDGYDIRMYLS